jgi:rhodanese-related sulfurtransferase
VGDFMKKILLSDYDYSRGIFIDLSNSKVVGSSMDVSYEDLLINHSELLDKSKKYYIYCKGGIKSRKAVNILEFYGYDVTLVYVE